MSDRRARCAGALRPALASAAIALLGGASLGGCGDTLQDQPIGPAPFESVIVQSRLPVYWVGVRYSGMQATGVSTDPGGAVRIQYGDCLVGGQYTCVTPLEIVTSPDNSFLPGGSTPTRALALRGVQALSRQHGSAIAVRTGAVVVSVYAHRAALARAAAQTMTPLNQAAPPGAPLPKPSSDTGFDRVPLPSQLPSGAG
ncbi:MAG: hypothetical protein ACTHM1_11355 [Solirubrobacteraceae bacterium]